VAQDMSVWCEAFFLGSVTDLYKTVDAHLIACYLFCYYCVWMLIGH